MRSKLKVYLTAKDTEDRLALKENKALNFGEKIDKAIEVFEDETYQTIEGFGGAFTEAAAYNFYKLGEENKNKILKAYFDKHEGNGYNLCRTHINSCDFSLGNYDYVEEYDVELKSFNIAREKSMLFHLLKRQWLFLMILNFCFSMESPAWMKTNGEMNNGGKLKEEFKDVWALYYAKYIKAMKEEGIDIWGITVQNEPEATQVWDSCRYTAEEERDFVKYHLGPTLYKEGLKHINIIVWDHNRDLLYERAKVILSDKEASKYVWGVGFHWYSGDQFENLKKTHEEFPDKKLLFTEGCQEGGVKLGDWNVGERYGHNIIGDLNNYTVGWVDWNLLLDTQGGPNHVGNYCDAPIIVDVEKDEIYFQSSYYYIGHFSRFIKRGAKRIGFINPYDSLEVTTFKNPDGTIVTVVMNKSDEDIDFRFKVGKGITELKSLRHSIMTLLVN
ncbi:glycoside hydrolase family 30 protein [Caloramator sp. Dgby_cultured_2]|uniref:glycoside hydrolase family 30 protein n=1 Tax=Caloramator sp. Dgby_cultured_2 TaxID=3029174 RepID=UPI00237DDA85|nr:glycoside hydrolase family 30 protein [Caloramator sp. Dgby_cultured_2]WDU83830.1 glycoside hydrolase family 30 protein [Caloramator sp. Dgby_cultured_2]